MASGPFDQQPSADDPFDRRTPEVVPPPNTNPWNVPNALTALRLVMVPLFGWMLLAHPYDFGWRFAATAVFVVAIFTDFLDGHLARKHNIVTTFGKVADPIADKALTGMAFIGLSIIGDLLGTPPGGAAWWVTITILAREWGITLLRFLVMRRGVIVPANKGGKAKMWVQSVALVAALLPIMEPFKWGAWLLVVAALVITVVTGVHYVVVMGRELFRHRTLHGGPGGEPSGPDPFGGA